MFLAGMDEAGRGCVFGPLVLCVAVVDDGREHELKEMGAKDSKMLSLLQREKLYPQVKGVFADHACVHISAQMLNELMLQVSLNEIEAMKAAEALNLMNVKPRKIIADSPDGDVSRFAKRIKSYLNGDAAGIEIVAEHKADVNHPIVSAASIIAKVERDRELEKIKGELGFDFGSGYCSDPRTIEFLKPNLHVPQVMKYVRTRWSTVDKLRQKTLCEF